MVAYTHDYDKAGTTTYLATVYTFVFDDDGDIEIGGEPHREDWKHSNEYKTLRGASDWVVRQPGDHADIYESKWIEDSFDDDEYGMVFDAYADPEAVMHFWHDGDEWIKEVT